MVKVKVFRTDCRNYTYVVLIIHYKNIFCFLIFCTIL